MDAATFPPVARERQIKRWTHEIKAALVAGDSKKVKSLAKRRVL
jgi:predicted GIY-YIG superfamily endonuclease